MEQTEIYSITFDYVKGKTDIIALFTDIVDILQNFDKLNNTLCRSIDSNIKASSYLLDIEKGSIKVFLTDILNSVPDDVLKEGDYKKIIGVFLVKAKHLILQKLNSTKQLPLAQRETELFNCVSEEYKKLPNNNLFQKELNKNEILSAINAVVQSSKKVDKVSFCRQNDFPEIIDTTFEYVSLETSKENKKTNSFDVSLIIKKPDLLTTSKWEFIFIDRKITATIEDSDFLNKVKLGEVSFCSNMEMSCRIRTEVLFSDNQEPEEAKYFIEKVHSIKNSTEHKQNLLNF